MRAVAIIGLGLALAGCAPTVAQRSSIEPGPVPVTVGDQAFVADLQRGGPGTRLTEDGALPTSGLSVTVASDDGRAVRDFVGAPRALPPVEAAAPAPALGQDDGRLAKAAAQAGCAAGGGRFDPAAIGKVSAAGQWTFEGACS